MTKNQILMWLKKYDDNYSKNEYIINEDMSVDVKGSVDISNKRLTKIPIKFNKIDGYFWCSTNKLTSLENCPNIVNGYFFCDYNHLTSLEHCPQIVNGGFLCNNNKLTSLEHCPKRVNGIFLCYNNKLKSLKGIGYIKGKLICDDHLKCSKEYKCYLILKQLQK